MEVAIEDSKQIFGAGQARNRTARAVERAIPFQLACQAIAVTWYATAGHDPADVEDHRARAPWYTAKARPSTADMAAKLRRVLIAARFQASRPDQPTPEESTSSAWPGNTSRHNRESRVTRRITTFAGDSVKESNERLLLGQARRDAFDVHRGYRVVEAMRNLVQHREMTPFNLNRNRQLDRQAGQVINNIEVVFPVSWLLESSKCPAKIKSEFKDSSAEMPSMIDIVDDAMSGFHEIFSDACHNQSSGMMESVNLLRQISGEAHPGLPVLLRIKRPEAGAIIQGGVQFEIHPIEDLLRLCKRRPSVDPTSHRTNADA